MLWENARRLFNIYQLSYSKIFSSQYVYRLCTISLNSQIELYYYCCIYEIIVLYLINYEIEIDHKCYIFKSFQKRLK